MTRIHIDLKAVTGKAFRGDKITLWAPAVRPGAGGTIITTDPVTVDLDPNGEAIVEAEPGPLMVKLPRRGVADVAAKEVVVPDQVSAVTLRDLLELEFEYRPAVVNEAREHANRAESAAQRIGTAEQVQQWHDGAETAAGEAKAAAQQIGDVGDALAAKADLVGGVIPTSQIPAVALTKPHQVANRAALLALTDVQEGDVGVITAGPDRGTLMLGDGPPSVWGSWVSLATSPDAPVQSVNGQTGTVVLGAGDVGAATPSDVQSAKTHAEDYTDAAIPEAIRADRPLVLPASSAPGQQFTTDVELPTTGDLFQNAGARGNVRFRVSVLVTILWDGASEMTVQSWNTNGSTATRDVAVIPAGTSGITRSVTVWLNPTSTNGTVYLLADGDGSRKAYYVLQRSRAF